MELTPKEIYEKIQDISAYQQEEFFRHYEGMPIKGVGSFNCFHDYYSEIFFKNKDKNSKCVSMWNYADESTLYPNIYFMVDLTNNPEFKFIKSGQKLVFNGKINKVTATEIFLVDGVKFDLKKEIEKISKNRFIIEEKQGRVNGVEIYAKNIINNGIIASGNRTKVVADSYQVGNNASSFSEKSIEEKWYQKWWGQLFLTILSGLIITFVGFKIGWNK